MMAGVLSAQTSGSNSPYSRYGFGLLADQAQGFNKGMGGVALGMRNGTLLNMQNPASYSAIDSLTFIFDGGVSLQFANFSGGGQRVNVNNSSLDYLNVAFRAWRNVGVSVGVVPFSSIGYEFSNSETLPDIDGLGELTTTTRFDGNGGIHQAYVGLGWEPVKNFSVGANFSYFWGDYTHTTQAVFSESSIQPLRRIYKANISNYKLDFGIQYETKLNTNNRLVLGATYGLGHALDASASFMNQRLNNGNVQGGDTLKARNAFELPHSFGIGATWKYKNTWTLGLDYTTQLWSKARYPQLIDDGVSMRYESHSGSMLDRHRVALGMEYLPNMLGMNYRDHIRYRAGVSYTTPYTKVNGQKGANEYSVSLGVGLPIMNRYNNRSILNISAQWEHVSPKAGNMITENYFRLCVGLTFNELWFLKRKVD